MHGDIDKYSTIVLKEADYLEYTQKHILMEMFIKSLLTDHTVLFLGYSLNDYNVKLIIGWINHIRVQNKVFDKSTKFAYIVLDEKKIANNQVNYFKSNNIGVINLHNMPLVNDIPDALTDPRGQRLYSFLRIIYDASLENLFGESFSYDDAINFLSKYRYVSYKNICKLLCINSYIVDGYELSIPHEDNYCGLINFLNSSSKNAEKLKQMFVDAGIMTIKQASYSTDGKSGSRQIIRYEFTDFNKSLLDSAFYRLYLYNDYFTLNKKLCDSGDEGNITVFHRLFYKTLIIKGYSKDIVENYRKIDYQKLTTQDKVVYLFNDAVLKLIESLYDGTQIIKYIKNIPNLIEKEFYILYLDVLDGNNKQLLKMERAFKDLKKDYFNVNYNAWGLNSLSKLFEIRQIAIEQYMFYFKNGLFYVHISNLGDIFKKYIEAIICTNGTFVEETEHPAMGKSKKERYSIENLDVDILTKFIEFEDLLKLIEEYKLKKFKAADGVVDFVVEAFKNITDSLIKLKNFNCRLTGANILINDAILLSHLDLTDEHKGIIAQTLQKLLTDEEFANFYFSPYFPGAQRSLKVFEKLLKQISVKLNFECIQRICTSPNFSQYCKRCGVYVVREFFSHCMDKTKLEHSQKELNDFILSFEDKNKVTMIRIFQKYITDKKIKKSLKTFLSGRFKDLEPHEIFELVFKNWLELSDEMSKEYQDDTVKIFNQKQSTKTEAYPDDVQQRSEIICILYITGIIKKLNIPKDFIDGNVFLKFLTDSDNFDYTKVDFSYYMWQNIARTPQLMEKIIAHKEEVIPQIQKKIHAGSATEFEKKILYGMLLSKEELLNE